jgi:hypothetical protein
MSYGEPDVMDSLESDLDPTLCSGLGERSEARAMRNIVPRGLVLCGMRNESVSRGRWRWEEEGNLILGGV